MFYEKRTFASRIEMTEQRQTQDTMWPLKLTSCSSHGRKQDRKAPTETRSSSG